MTQIDDFELCGGQYWETTIMKNLLNHYDLSAPHTGEPVSEAMCLGLSGGIAAGYSFCPSIPKHAQKSKIKSLDRSTPKSFNESLYQCGSGSAFIGRSSAYSTNGATYRDLFSRLGIKTDFHESTGIKGAEKKLVEAIDSGKPAVVWSCPVPFSSLGFVGTYGMYTLLVLGIDSDSGKVTLADRAKKTFEMNLEDFNYCRSRVCSLKNRSMTLSPPKSIAASKFKSAIKSGIQQTVENILKPKMKTFGPPGLEGLTKVMANPKNQKGWPKVYPGGLIYLALRDMFDSIETAATGGGLYREMYAEFLDEAAEVLNKKGLAHSANQYRELSTMWSALADYLLPNKVKPFKQTKSLLRKLDKTFVEKGPKGQKAVEKTYADLANIEQDMKKKFVWAESESIEFLSDVSESIVPIIEREIAAAKELSKAI